MCGKHESKMEYHRWLTKQKTIELRLQIIKKRDSIKKKKKCSPFIYKSIYLFRSFFSLWYILISYPARACGKSILYARNAVSIYIYQIIYTGHALVYTYTLARHFLYTYIYTYSPNGFTCAPAPPPPHTHTSRHTMTTCQFRRLTATIKSVLKQVCAERAGIFWLKRRTNERFTASAFSR